MKSYMELLGELALRDISRESKIFQELRRKKKERELRTVRYNYLLRAITYTTIAHRLASDAGFADEAKSLEEVLERLDVRLKEGLY